MIEKLESGRCDAYVDVSASLELVKGLNKYCKHGLAIPAQPIRSLPTIAAAR